MSDFVKPFNLITLALAIVGLGLAVYFYVSTLPVIRVYYLSDTALVARLDDPNQQLSRPDLTIVKDGHVLNTRSLFRTIIGVWNAGTIPIDPDKVRRDLTIEFQPPDSILDAKIVFQSSSVIKLELNQTANAAIVKWAHLDPKYAIIIAIYHYKNGGPQASLRYIGDSEILDEVSNNLKTSYYPGLVWFGIFIVVILTSVILAMIGSFVDKFLPEKFQKVSLIIFLITFVLGFVYLGVVAYTDRIYGLTRSVLGITAPSQISDLIPIDPVHYLAR